MLVLNTEGGHEPGMQAAFFSKEVVVMVVGRGKEMDSPFEPPEKNAVQLLLILAQLDPLLNSDLQNCNIKNLYCFKMLNLLQQQLETNREAKEDLE